MERNGRRNGRQPRSPDKSLSFFGRAVQNRETYITAYAYFLRTDRYEQS